MKLPFGFTPKPLFFAWILLIIALALILKSCLYSDDAPDYQMRLSLGPMSFVQMLDTTYSAIVLSLKTGRFIPVSYLLQSVLYWLSPTILIYKILILIINLWAVYAFTRLLRNLELKEWIPFSLLLFCAIAQFYIDYHDPFTTIHAMFPLLAVLIFSAISCFVIYLRSGYMGALLGSVMATILAILDSEIGFIIYPILIIILMSDPRRFSRKVIVAIPFFILFIIYAIGVILIRRNTQQVYSGVEANFELRKMAGVVFFQLLATIPLTGFARLSAIPRFLLEGLIELWPLILLNIGMIYFMLRADRITQYTEPQIKKKRALWMIGLVLWIFPAFILMASKKYQVELGFGMGYLPVYIQDFGLVLLIILFFSGVAPKDQVKRRKIKNAVYIFAFILFLLTFLRNDFFINLTNTRRAIPACFYYKSLKNGILNECEDGSVIVLRTDYFFHSPQFYQVIINNLYAQRMLVIAEENFTGVEGDDKRGYYLLEHNKDGQFTKLSKLSSTGNKVIKQIKYPRGKDFSYFDLISRPL